MNKTAARNCKDCKAICKKGCAFSFPIRKVRVGEGTDQRLYRFPLVPCFKSTTAKKFNQVSEYMEQKNVS